MEDSRVVVSCRACLLNSSEHKFFPLFSTNSEFPLKLSNLFKTLSGLSVDQQDGLPQMLCNSCVQIMIQFYKFRLMCKTNNRRFRATKATLEQNQSKGAKTATNCFTHDALEKVDEEKCDRNNFVVQGNSTKACQSIEENRTNSDIQIIDDIPPVKKQSASNNKQNQNLCPICGKWYKKSTHLDTHSNAKPYGCHQCDKSFKTGSDLRVHLRTHTGERRKICNVCYKAFVTTSALYKHIRMHTGERPFQCTLCKKTFSESCALERHERVHTGDRPYKCQVCGKGFSQSTSRNRHQKVHKRQHT